MLFRSGVTAKASHTSATVSWTGDSDSYNVHYRTPAKDNASFFDNFEDGLAQWTIIRNGGGTANTDWRQVDATNFNGGSNHSGDYVAMSRSWASSSYSVDNWLITPQVTLGGTLKFWVRDDGAYHEHYDVYVSTTTNDVSAFTLLYSPGDASSTWEEVSVDLSSYAGQTGYIALRHTDEDQDYLWIDDFGIYSGTIPAGAWTTESTTETSISLTGLEMDTEYEYQVQGVCLPSDESEWTVIASFTTLSENDKLFLAAGDWNVADNWVPAGVPSTTNNAYIRAAVSIPSGVVATAKNIVIDGGSITLKDGAELKTPSHVNVTMEKSIAGYGDGEGNFNLIASPASGGSASTEIDGLMEGNYDYFRFVRTMDLEWRSYALTNFDMTPGNGYLYANKENKTLKFTGETWASSNNRLSMSVTYSDSYPMNMVLAGNPFTCTATLYYVDGSDNMTGTIYKMNAAGDGFDMYAGYVTVAPGEAVFVEYGESGDVYYESEDYGNGTYLGAAEILLPQHGSTANVDAGPVVELADNADNSSLITSFNGKYATVKLTGRTLYKNDAWNSLCLPFDVSDLTGTPLESAIVKELDTTGDYSGNTTGVNGSTLYLYFKDATSIEAGKPYFVKWASGENIVAPAFSNVIINSTSPTAVKSTDDNVTFVGNYDPISIAGEDKSILFLTTGNKLDYPNAAMTFGAFRAHFELADGVSANALVLDFGNGETTSISEKKINGEDSEGAWYMLDGRKMDNKPTQHGVYINNGRKVVIK